MCLCRLLAVSIGLSAPLSAPAQTRPPVETIAAVRVDADGDGVPDRLGDTVSVRGVALVGTGALHHQQLDVSIGDEGATVFLFGLDTMDRFEAGDSVAAWGVVTQYSGKTQIEVLEYQVGGRGGVPEPLELERLPADLEAIEGRLVRFDARVVSKGRNQGGPFLVVLPDGAPERPLTVYARGTSAAAAQLGDFSPSDHLRVVGLLGQYDQAPPLHDAYQVYPRAPADLVRVGVSRELLARGALAGLFLLVAALVWSLVLRREVRRQTEALRASEEQASLLMERSPGAVIVLADQDVLYANRAAHEILGAADDVRSLGAVLEPDSAAALAEAAGEDDRAPWQGHLHTLSGRQVEVEVWTVPVTYQARPARQVWLHDVSERNRHLREREALAEQAEERRRLESVVSLAGGLAHGYNNLMASVLGNAGLLAETEGLDGEERGLVSGIEKAAVDATELTTRLLQVAGRAGLRRQVADVSGLVGTVAREVAEARGTAPPVLSLAGAATVLGDPEQLREMVRALLTNAYEAAGDCGELIEATVRIEDVTTGRIVKAGALPPGRYVRLTLTDRGEGLSPGVLARAFDPMFSTRSFGRGLGLPTARGIAEAHGGGLALESTPSTGTRVDVYLPST